MVTLRRGMGALALLAATFLGTSVFGADGEGTRRIDLREPPKHLEHTALVELLKSRGLTAFPKSFESLVRQLTYADAYPVTAFVPAGRSAQAAQTDADQPRRLVTAHGANKVAARVPIGAEDYTALNGPDWEGRLYFGHAEKPAQAEVLSWNRDRRVFDKFVVTSMDGKSTPIVAEVTDGSQCTQCHQNDAPIFTLPPWSEIVTHEPKKLFRDAVQASLPAEPRLYRKSGVLVHREQTPSDNNVGLAMDSASSTGNRLVQATRVIRDVCGNDDDCRRNILVAAMSNLAQSAYLRKNFVADKSQFKVDFVNGPAARLKQQAEALAPALKPLQRALKRHWPATGFAYVSQLLTDPTAGIAGDAPISTLDPRAPRAALLPIDADSAGAYVTDVAFETLGFTLADARVLQAYPPTDLVNRFTPGTPNYDEKKVGALLASWPPTRQQILAYVTDGAVRTEAAAPLVANDATTLKGHFGKYCAGCHGKDSENGTIPFDDLTALGDFEKKTSGKVAARVVQSTMPPPKAKAQPTAEERREMAAFLQRQRDGGAALRATPPVSRSHLGVRYVSVPGLDGSYVGRDDWAVHEEGSVEQCAVGAPGLRAARIGGARGPVVLALDNFPQYAVGNLVQGPVATVADGRCLILAVTRNGALVRLGWDSEERGWYSQLLAAPGAPTTVGHLAAAPVAKDSAWSTVVAVGRDGKLYRLTFSATAVTFSPIAVSGVGAGAGWSRIAFAGGGTRRLFVERLDGRVVALSYEGSAAMFDRLAGKNEAVFAPSLLRADGVLLNPYGPEPEGQRYERLTLAELDHWTGFAESPRPSRPAPAWNPPPEPPRPPAAVTAAACNRSGSVRECREKTIGERCVYKTASGPFKEGSCRVVSGTSADCTCY